MLLAKDKPDYTEVASSSDPHPVKFFVLYSLTVDLKNVVMLFCRNSLIMTKQHKVYFKINSIFGGKHKISEIKKSLISSKHASANLKI